MNGSLPRRLLGTLLYLALVPSLALVAVPFALSGWKAGMPRLGLAPLPPLPWLGGTLVVLGGALFAAFLRGFLHEGRGTPSPVAPPRRLVVHGVFRFTRNPAYVASLAIVLGQGLLLGSAPILVWAAMLAVGFHQIVVTREEPTLCRRFGPAYDAYRRRVPRWIGRSVGAAMASREPVRP